MDVSVTLLLLSQTLQVTQKDDGIFISQDKYVDEILKKFGFSTVKTASTPMETSKPLLKDAEAEDLIYLKGQPKLGLWYPKDSPFDLEAYTNSDYACVSLDRKSTTGDRENCKQKELRDKVRIKTERQLVGIKIDDGNAFWNEIEVKTGNSKVNAVGHYLVLLGIT
ncbi:hypothetical protein Tco_0255356 [Tanacetum coccineum]